MTLKASLLLCFLAVCHVAMARDVTPIRPGEKPAQGSTEAELWYGMDQAEAGIRSSPIRIHDPELNRYVQGVLCKVTGEYCRDLRLYLIDVPVFNASMAPNGVVMVFSGALLRMQDEAELAMVLGHEFAHYRQRHSLQSWSKTKATTAFLSTFGAATIAGGVGLLGNLAQLAGLATIMQYSRDNEREADVIGFRIVTGLGYDPKAGERVWQRMLNEENANIRAKHNPVFASHPKTAERLQDMKEAAAGYHGGAHETFRNEFDRITEPFLNHWLEAELSRRMFDTSIQVIRDLKADARPELAGVYDFYLAEALRRRGRNDDLGQSAVLYASAIAHENTPPAAWREHGLALKREGRRESAIESLKTYLEKDPGAEDRLFVLQDIAELEQRP